MAYSIQTKEKIAEFILRSKNKIAELASDIARDQDDCKEDLLLDLSDFIENLVNCYYNVDEHEVIKTIDYYSSKANLLMVPLLQIPCYDIFIKGLGVIIGGGNNGGDQYLTINNIIGLENILNEFLTEADVLTIINNNGGSTGGNERLTEDYTVLGVDVGNLPDGTVLETGMSALDILKEMLTKEIPPVYVLPTLVLNTTHTSLVEVGTNIIPGLTSIYTQNDAGNILGYKLTRNGLTIHQSPTVTTFTDSKVIAEEILNYQSAVQYSAGLIKKTNLGNNWLDGRITAGTVLSNIVSVEGARKAFFGTNLSNITSNAVRLLANGLLKPIKGTKFTIPIPINSNSVTFAYPAVLGDVTDVEYVEGFYAEIDDIFTKVVIQVEGANGYPAIPYNVYTYVPAVPYSELVHYIVTI